METSLNIVKKTTLGDLMGWLKNDLILKHVHLNADK